MTNDELSPAADTVWTGYSLAERDRRWRAARESAARAGFDCIFVPLGNGLDAEYLTQMTTAVVVMPTDGRDPIVVNDRGRGNEWVSQVRFANREWAELSAEALLDAGMANARIGVVGLKGGMVTHVRSPEGVVIHSPYAEEVREKLPSATFEDATDVVGFVRYVKSDEEIECLRKSAAIAEAGIEKMIEVARPGVDEAVLYARVSGRMLELGSEHYHWALETGPLGEEGERVRLTAPPVGRRLRSGTYITNEVSAIWGGMVAQEVQPILLGAMPAEARDTIEFQREVFEAGLERMRPGTTFGELIDLINGLGSSRGVGVSITLHGRGMGDDGPLITPRSPGEKVRNLPMEKGNAWVWKPSTYAGVGGLRFQWGGTVVVTEAGGQRLSRRPQGLVCVS